MQDRSQENPQKTPTNQKHSPDEGVPSLHSKTFPSTISPISLLLRQVILEDTANRSHDAQLQARRAAIVATINAEVDSTPVDRLNIRQLEKKFEKSLHGVHETFMQAVRAVSSTDPEKSNLLTQYRLQMDNRFALAAFSLLEKPLESLTQDQSTLVEQVAALDGKKLARFLDRVFLEPLDVSVTFPLLENVIAVTSPEVFLEAAKILTRQYEEERTNQRSELLNMFRIYAAFDPAEGDKFHNIARVVYATTTSRSCRNLVVELATAQGIDFSDLYLAVARNDRYPLEKRRPALRHWAKSRDKVDPETLATITTFLSDSTPLIVREAVRMLLTSPVADNLGEKMVKDHVMSSLRKRQPSLALSALISIISPEAAAMKPEPPVTRAIYALKDILGERVLSNTELDGIIRDPSGITFKNDFLNRDTKLSHISEQFALSLPTDLILELLAGEPPVSTNTDTILRAMPAHTRGRFEELLRRHIAAIPEEQRTTLYRAAKLYNLGGGARDI